MDREYSFREYTAASKATEPENLTRQERRAMAALGLAGETGEVVDMVKKDLFHPHKTINPADLMLEIGDVLWYLAALAAAYGYTLEQCAVANVHKLNKRYPNGFPTVEA